MENKYHDGMIDAMKISIDNGYTSLLSTINSEVNLLFWEIGNVIKNPQHVLVDNDLPISLSNKFSPIFGAYLSQQNLSSMKLFAEKCSISTIGQISDSINWGCILNFLDFEGEKTLLSYINQIETKDLEPIVLNDEKFIPRLSLKSLFRTSCNLYFGSNEARLFRKLFEPQPKDDKILASFLSIYANDITVMNVYKLILDFQSETHYVLNMQFNMLMWDVGNRISRYASGLKISIEESIGKFIVEFGNYFPSIFNKEELSYCIKLAEQYEKSSDMMDFAEIVSWPHIKVLLDINSVEKRKFIANEIFNHGIGVHKLKQMMANNSFDKNTASSSTVPIKRSSTTTETRVGNYMTSITEYIMKPIVNPIHDLNRNIYKSPEVLNFLTNNSF